MTTHQRKGNRTIMEPMYVLVVETERGASARTAAALVEAGHEVLRCHPEHTNTFPCNAFRGDSFCPVRHAPIDVALTVRNRPLQRPAALEDGALCAIEHGIPLVVSGPTPGDAYRFVASETVPHDADLVAALERHASVPFRPDGSTTDAPAGPSDAAVPPQRGLRIVR